MATIGVSMIVRNEEELLSKCLDSIKGIDEIVICDTGSDDKTIEIAKRYTDKVYTEFKWNDSFCDARNFALSKSTADWVLVLDADETLEPGGLEKLREEISKTKKRVLYFKVAAGTSFFYNVRAHKRDPDIIWKEFKYGE